jgi:hypothetical protein
MEKNKIKCYRCNKVILPRSKYIRLETFDLGKRIEDVFFHFSCWQSFNDLQVQNKIKEYTNFGLGFLNEKAKRLVQ